MSFIDIIIGDREKWRKMPDAFKELKEELKTRRAVYLITVFIVCLGIVYGFMMGLRYIQNNAQYCNLIENNIERRDNYQRLGDLVIGNEHMFNMTREVEIINDIAKPIPENNKSWAYYLRYYKDGRKQVWLGFNCSFNFKRFKQEMIGK